MDARFKQAGRDFLLLSLLVSPVAYFLGSSVGGLIAQFFWTWDADHGPSGVAAWVMIGVGLLAISYSNRIVFRRLSARLVEQAVQLGPAADGASRRS